jgi:16S rRNA (guanine966-N2)-methyltransferase
MPEAGRVIAGTARGVRLVSAPADTRPLSDRVKQALFASLEADGSLSGGFLDLFAGTGAAGIEALSRRADRAVFVEKSSRAASVIEENLRRTRLSGGLVVRANVLSYLANPRADAIPPFGAALVDPPYDQPLVTPTLELLGDAERGWLGDDSVVVAKHFWRDEPPEQVGSLRRDRQKRFGETMLSFYTRKRPSDHGGTP